MYQQGRGLFADGPDMAERLAGVTLCNICVASVCLNLDNEAAQFQTLLGFVLSFERDKE
jgi:hypothetical protein